MKSFILTLIITIAAGIIGESFNNEIALRVTYFVCGMLCTMLWFKIEGVRDKLK